MAAAISPTGAARARGATSRPTSLTVISFSKNSLSSSEVNPMRTGRGWFCVAWKWMARTTSGAFPPCSGFTSASARWVTRGRTAPYPPGPLPARPALHLRERPLGHRRQEHLVAHPCRLQDHAILELRAHAAAQGRDHGRACPRPARAPIGYLLASPSAAARQAPAPDTPPGLGRRPVTRDMPVRARPRASATWDGRGSSARPSKVWTPRCIWLLPAAPLLVTARFTSDAARAST